MLCSLEALELGKWPCFSLPFGQNMDRGIREGSWDSGPPISVFWCIAHIWVSAGCYLNHTSGVKVLSTSVGTTAVCVFNSMISGRGELGGDLNKTCASWKHLIASYSPDWKKSQKSDSIQDNLCIENPLLQLSPRCYCEGSVGPPASRLLLLTRGSSDQESWDRKGQQEA